MLSAPARANAAGARRHHRPQRRLPQRRAARRLVGLVLVVLVGVILLRRRRFKRLTDQWSSYTYGEKPRPPTRAELVESIAQLDARFEAGELDPEDYQRRRELRVELARKTQ